MSAPEDRVQVPPAEEPSFEDYWMMVYRRRWILLAVVLIAAVSTGVITARIESRYKAVATFFILMSATQPAGIWGGSEWEAAVPVPGLQVADVYSEILRGRDYKLKVLEDFPELTLDYIEDHVTIRSERTGLIQVAAWDVDPERGARLANRFVEHLPELLRAPVAERVTTEFRLISEEIDRSKEILGETLEAQRDVLQANSITSVEAEVQGVQRRLFDLRLRVDRAETRREAIARQIESLETTSLQAERTALQAEWAAQEVEIEGTRRLIAETEVRLRSLVGLAERLEGLQEEAARRARGRDVLTEARRNLDLGTLREPDYLLITQVAEPPPRPALPNLPFNVMLSLVLGFFAGLTLTFVLGTAEHQRGQRKYLLEESKERASRLLELFPTAR